MKTVLILTEEAVEKSEANAHTCTSNTTFEYTVL